MSQKFLENISQFYPKIADRLDQRSTDNNRPIIWPIFDRLIGIGRIFIVEN